jgi:hypothetical protein
MINELNVGGLYKWVTKEGQTYVERHEILVPDELIYVLAFDREERFLSVFNLKIRHVRWKIWCEKYGETFWTGGEQRLYGFIGHFEEINA